MILDQDKARVENRYSHLKRRAKSQDMIMKHLGTRASEGENTDVYFDNFELTGSDFKTVFYNIFTMTFDLVLYIVMIIYLWGGSVALWTVIAGLSGASVILFYLLATKIMDTIYMIKLIKLRKQKVTKSLA